MSKIVAIWGRDDFNTGTAANDAYRSVQAGLNTVSNNQAVIIYTGRYVESLFDNTNVTVTIIGQGLVRVLPPSPTAYFIDFNNRSVHLENLHIEEFSNVMRFRVSTGRTLSIQKCYLSSANRGTVLVDKTVVQEDRQYLFTASQNSFINQDVLNVDIESVEFCTIHNCYWQIDYNNYGDGYIQNTVITSSHFNFTKQVVIMQNILVGDLSTFTYDDGVNSVTDVDFATFQAANQAHNWGFDLSGCQVVGESTIYVDSTRKNLTVQSSSVAVGMASNRGVVGAFGIGKQLNATDAGWQNNTDFVLNVDQFEAAGAAEIESPIIDYTINQPITRIGGGMQDAWEDGRLFDALGNLGAAILSGGSQIGLSVALTEGTVYAVDGFIEVETNLRSFTITEQQCFTALANEEIIEVTASGSGEIREVIYLDGKVRIKARWWKDGESEPNTWTTVTRDLPVLVDSNGYGNGDPLFDEQNFPRHPVARYLRVKSIVSTNNLNS